jgi:hypothetical protein
MLAGLTAINQCFDIAHLIMATEFVPLIMKQTTTAWKHLKEHVASARKKNTRTVQS